MKLLIAGKRDYKDQDYLNDILDNYARLFGAPDEVVHGNSMGTDTMVNKWAMRHKYPIKVFGPVSRAKYDKQAVMLRIMEMTKYGDKLIAFWDGFSNETDYTIQEMKSRGKPVIIVDITQTGIPEIFNTNYKFENEHYVWSWSGGQWELVLKHDSEDRLMECWYAVTDNRTETMCRDSAFHTIMTHEVTQRLPEGATYERHLGGDHDSVVFFKGISQDDLDRIAFSICPSETVIFGVLS